MSVRDPELYLSKCSHLGSPVPFIQVNSKQETYFYEFYIAKFVSALMFRVFHCWRPRGWVNADKTWGRIQHDHT